MDDKTDLRIRFKELRKTLDIEGLSTSLCRKFCESELFLSSQNIMLYHPLRYEVKLLSLLDNLDKKFYLPRVNGEELEVCPYNIGDELRKSSIGIFEPTCEKVSPEILDLVVVPALAVDKKNYRLGYGGGFYDRFLRGRSVKTVVLIPEVQVVEELPTNSFDVSVDYVISV